MKEKKEKGKPQEKPEIPAEEKKNKEQTLQNPEQKNQIEKVLEFMNDGGIHHCC